MLIKPSATCKESCETYVKVTELCILPVEKASIHEDQHRTTELSYWKF